MSGVKVILTGTDPSSRKGGIGFAMGGYLAALKYANINYVSIPTYHPTRAGGKAVLFLTSLPRIAREIRGARKLNEIPIVYSHAGAGLSLFREFGVLLFSRMLSAKTVIQLHAPEINNYLEDKNQKRLLRILSSFADRLFVLTPWWERRLREKLSGEIVVIPNPMPAAWEKESQKAHNRSDTGGGEIKIITVTRLEPGKGVDLVVEAMKYLPTGFKSIIAGSGSQLSALKARVEELGLNEKITFTGWLDGPEKRELFNTAHIFCLPSSYDSFGMGFMEAMANGLPVVAMNWGPIGDVVPKDRAGFLINKPDPVELADSLRALQDPVLRSQMGKFGKQWVLEKYSHRVVGDALAAAFKTLAP